MVIDEDQKRKVTTEEVAQWVLRKDQQKPFGDGEKPG
jgi:hypothetical protein